MRRWLVVFPICQVRVANQYALTPVKQMCLRALVRLSCFLESTTVGTCVFMTNKNDHISSSNKGMVGGV